MRKRTWMILLLAGLALAAWLPGPALAAGLLGFLPNPAETSGLTPAGPPQEAAGEALFDLIDGGAEAVLEFGFQRALSQAYAEARSGQVILEIYEMVDSAGAYGLYASRLAGPGELVELGQEGRREEGYLVFWKGRYCVTVAGPDDSPGDRAARLDLGRAVDRLLTERGARPALLAALPPAEPGSALPRYVRGPLALGRASDVFAGPCPGLQEAAVGQYGTTLVHLLRFSKPSEAEARFKSLGGQARPPAEGVAAALADPRRKLAAELVGPYLLAVSGSESDQADQILAAVRARLGR